jgi:hypothetical protein
MKYLASLKATGRSSGRAFVGALCLIVVALPALAQGAAQKPATQGAQPQQKSSAQQSQTLPQPKVQTEKGRLPLYARDKVTLADLNVDIHADPRVIAVMAALNAAGYDYEPGSRQLSALRQQLRADLQNINPSLARRLRDYFQSHRKAQSSDAAAVAPYLSLALTLTAPPVFSIDAPVDRLPEDVREITDFPLLLEEFYRETRFSSLMPKYLAAYQAAAQSYGPPSAQVLSDVIAYLHTEPILELPPLYASRPAASNRRDAAEPVKLANRERRFVVIPDLLNASNAVNLRVVRDSYYVLVGPSVEPGDAVRRAFLRFVIDPLMERQVKEVAAIRGELRDLVKSRGDKVDPEYAERSYFLLSDSLAQAIDVRLDILESLAGRTYKDEAELKKALVEANERAIYELSFPYERGAALVYNFYEKMATAEGAGVNLRDYLGSLLQISKGEFDRESKRLEEHAQRISRYKEARAAAAVNAPPPTALISNSDQQVVAQLDEADRLIRAEQYAAARTVLEGVRRQRPNNARTLFGLAEVGSKLASKITDKDRLDEELYASVQLYKEAAENASAETEKWLVQRSYVAAAKILDFLDQAEDATAAYAFAVKMGDVPGGAFQEAQKAMKERQEKKPNQ